jgi:hypothetical protein
MTRRQSHKLQILWIPRTQDNPPVIRVVLQLMNHLRQLIDTLASIIRLGIDILCAEMPPLEPVDRTKITDCAVGDSNAVKIFAGSISISYFPSHIFMPAAVGGRKEVEPEINQRSSAITARRKTRLVVRRGADGRSCWGGEFEFERTWGEERLCSCASSLPPSVDCRDKLRASGTCLVDVLQSPGSRGSSRDTGVLHACQ